MKKKIENTLSPSLEDLITLLKDNFDTPNPEFLKLLEDLFSPTLVSDEAFHILSKKTTATTFITELLVVYEAVSQELAERAGKDNGSWYQIALLDCISVAKSPKVLHLLERELQHSQASVRHSAIWNLARLAKHNVEARKILSSSWKYEFASKEETLEFREEVQKALNQN